MSLLEDFAKFVLDMQAAAGYLAWARDNHGGSGYSIDNPKTGSELQKWIVFRDQILRGTRPAPPAMTTALGKGLVDGGVEYLDATAPVNPPPPPPPPTRGAQNPPAGPFTDRTTALWGRLSAGGTISKQRVQHTKDYGIAVMGTFSPAPPDPAAGTYEIDDCITQYIGNSPPTSNGTAEAGLWLGQNANARRGIYFGTWESLWVGCQFAGRSKSEPCIIEDLVLAIQAPDGSFSKTPGIGGYPEHAARRWLIRNCTIMSHGNGLNNEWAYHDSYSKWVKQEYPLMPDGISCALDWEMHSCEIFSDAWGVFIDAGGCGISIHDCSITATKGGVIEPVNIAIPSMPNKIDLATIDYYGPGQKHATHNNAMGMTHPEFFRGLAAGDYELHPDTFRNPVHIEKRLAAIR